jgi:hypothetical protein
LVTDPQVGEARLPLSVPHPRVPGRLWEFRQLRHVTVTDGLQCRSRFAFGRAILVRADACRPA